MARRDDLHLRDERCLQAITMRPGTLAELRNRRDMSGYTEQQIHDSFWYLRKTRGIPIYWIRRTGVWALMNTPDLWNQIAPTADKRAETGVKDRNALGIAGIRYIDGREPSGEEARDALRFNALMVTALANLAPVPSLVTAAQLEEQAR